MDGPNRPAKVKAKQVNWQRTERKPSPHPHFIAHLIIHKNTAFTLGSVGRMAELMDRGNTQFWKLRALKGSDLNLCNDTDFDLHLVILNTSYWQLPFHSTLVTRRPYIGHDN